MRTFVLVAVLLGAASIVQMWPTPSRPWSGVITEVEPGQWIRVANDMSDPGGLRIALTTRTRVDGDAAALRPGARVTVLYAYTGGGSVARRVVILPDDARR
jgi:hypothetical protein